MKKFTLKQLLGAWIDTTYIGMEEILDCLWLDEEIYFKEFYDELNPIREDYFEKEDFDNVDKYIDKAFKISIKIINRIKKEREMI